MQDLSERIKRRRLHGYEQDDLSLVQAAAGPGVDFGYPACYSLASNAELASLLLRQQLLAAEQQADALALSRARDPARDSIIDRLRQSLLNQQLQQHQAARLKAASDQMSYRLRAQEAAAASYASLLGSTAAGSHSLSNSFLLEQALGNESAAAAASSTLVSQLSHSAIGAAQQLRAFQMQSVLGAHDREVAAPVASVAADAAGNSLLQHLLGLTTTTGNNGGQASILAQIQNERAMAAAVMGVGAPFASLVSSHSEIPAAPAGIVSATAGLNRDLHFGGQGAGTPHPGDYLSLTAGGAEAARGLTGHVNDAVPPKKRPAPTTTPTSTGRQAIHLFMSCDMDDLSPYQCLVRKQIELFEASEEDAETNARGRNRPIVVGQVGIRCKHCKMLPPRKRERAAIYYPSKLDRLYQAGQTMASVHLGQQCKHLPDHLRQELARLREGKSAALAGKKYWSDGARALGVMEDDERLFFNKG